MSEGDFWRNIVRPQLSPFGMVRRIENVVEEGTPDVYCCLKLRKGDNVGSTIFIELKHAREWPKRYETTFRFGHFALSQVLWQEAWHRAGGRSCVLAQVGTDFVLIPPWSCRRVYEGVNRSTLLSLAEVHGDKVFPTGRIMRWLTEC